MSGVRMWQCVAVRLLMMTMMRTSLLMRVANGKRLKSDWKSANISLSYLEATSVAKPPPSLKPRMFMSKLS